MRHPRSLSQLFLTLTIAIWLAGCDESPAPRTPTEDGEKLGEKLEQQLVGMVEAENDARIQRFEADIRRMQSVTNAEEAEKAAFAMELFPTMASILPQDLKPEIREKAKNHERLQELEAEFERVLTNFVEKYPEAYLQGKERARKTRAPF